MASCRMLTLLSFILLIMIFTFVAWHFSIPTYLQSYPYRHGRSDVSYETKGGQKKSFYRFLMYSAEKKVDVETEKFIFKTCNVTFPTFQVNETRLDKFSRKFTHLRDCVRGWDVVVFNVHEMPGPRLLRGLRSSGEIPVSQLWAYYNRESPYNTVNVREGRFDGIFNLTMTPLRSSDVMTLYGYYRKSANLRDLRDLREKTRYVAWVASHCYEQRDSIVAALIRHIPIDIYGKCGRKFQQNRKCDRYSENCENLLSQYKFVLAFENSLCKDYVTEKYWNAVYRGSIPIVYGGSSYDSKLVVPNSFINVHDFKSISELAKHISYVNKSQKAFLSYQRWRMKYVIDFKPHDRHRFEIIGEKLYDLLARGVERRTYHMSSFYDKKQYCNERRKFD